jgi:hypothetical protein
MTAVWRTDIQPLIARHQLGAARARLSHMQSKDVETSLETQSAHRGWVSEIENAFNDAMRSTADQSRIMCSNRDFDGARRMISLLRTQAQGWPAFEDRLQEETGRVDAAAEAARIADEEAAQRAAAELARQKRDAYEELARIRGEVGKVFSGRKTAQLEARDLPSGRNIIVRERDKAKSEILRGLLNDEADNFNEVRTVFRRAEDVLKARARRGEKETIMHISKENEAAQGRLMLRNNTELVLEIQLGTGAKMPKRFDPQGLVLSDLVRILETDGKYDAYGLSLLLVYEGDTAKAREILIAAEQTDRVKALLESIE